MSDVANEFARPLRIDALGEADRDFTIAADADERAALARRFGLVAIDRLTAGTRVRRTGEIVFVEGRIAAEVVQSCVATGEPLTATVDVPFSLRFVPEAMEFADEVELSEVDCDTIPYGGGVVDIGEAVAETLVLALDPFPRAPGADAALRAAGVLEEGEAGPFAGLKALRDRLSE